MKAVSFLHEWAALLFRRRARRSVRIRQRTCPSRLVEGLEPRWVLSTAGAAPPAVVMLSATTTDSRSITIDYQVNPPQVAADPFQLGIYRSSDDRFDPADTLVDRMTLVPPGGPS